MCSCRSRLNAHDAFWSQLAATAGQSQFYSCLGSAHSVCMVNGSTRFLLLLLLLLLG